MEREKDHQQQCGSHKSGLDAVLFAQELKLHTVSAKYGTFKTCECHWLPRAHAHGCPFHHFSACAPACGSGGDPWREWLWPSQRLAKAGALSWCCLRKKDRRLSAEWILPLISMTSRQETLPPWGRAPMHSVGLWALSAAACQRSVGLWTFESTAARQQEPRLCRHAPQHFHWHFCPASASP